MDLPALLVSDLHLTNNPKDSYRWGLFPWLERECRSHHVRTLAILGDVTDAKDYHPAELVQRVVSSVQSCAQYVEQVVILTGNHDFLREGAVFFEFLRVLDRVQFVTKPWESDGDTRCLWLPYTKAPAQAWASFDFSHYSYTFIHQTAKGSVASNGQKMEGESLPKFTGTKVYSGDIHVPQQIGEVEYVGSPYHVHFGDKFAPRAVLLTRKGAQDLHFPCLQRFVIKCGSVQELRELLQRDTERGDQVRVRIALTPEERHEWAHVRREVVLTARQAEVTLEGVELIPVTSKRVQLATATRSATRSPSALLENYVAREGWGADALEVGLELL